MVQYALSPLLIFQFNGDQLNIYKDVNKYTDDNTDNFSENIKYKTVTVCLFCLYFLCKKSYDQRN